MVGAGCKGRIKTVIFTAVLSAGLFCCFNFAAAQPQEKWNEEKSGHFIIYYKNAPGDFISLLAEKAEDYYDTITQELGFARFDFWTWDARAQIYVFDSSEDYRRVTGQPSWSAGAVAVEQKIISTYAFARGFTEAMLPHEIGHIIFREFVGFRNPAVPLWLDEGVAAYREKERYSTAKEFLRGKKAKGGFYSLEQLSAIKKAQGLDQQSAQVFYNESFSLVDFLISDHGSRAFVIFCRNLRDKEDLKEAVASSYPFKSLEEMEEGWLDYLEKG